MKKFIIAILLVLAGFTTANAVEKDCGIYAENIEGECIIPNAKTLILAYQNDIRFKYSGLNVNKDRICYYVLLQTKDFKELMPLCTKKNDNKKKFKKEILALYGSMVLDDTIIVSTVEIYNEVWSQENKFDNKQRFYRNKTFEYAYLQDK